MHPISTRPTITVTADGAGVASHAGSRLLADLADVTTLSGELGEVLAVDGRWMGGGGRMIRVGC